MTNRRRRCIHVYQGSRDTDVSLKEFIESRLDTMDKALGIAREIVEEKLRGFPLEYMRKVEYEKAHEQICHQVEEVRKSVEQVLLDLKNSVYPKLENKSTQMIAAIAISGLVSGLFVALASGLIRHLWP